MSRKKPIGPEDHPDWGRSDPDVETFEVGDPDMVEVAIPPEMRAAVEARMNLQCSIAHRMERVGFVLFLLYLPSILLVSFLNLLPWWVGTLVMCGLGGSTMFAAIAIRRLSRLVHYLPVVTMIQRDE